MTEHDITLCGHGSGNPSLKDMHDYLESRYQSFASNGKRRGLVCVRRFKGLSSPDREAFTATYSTILGRNIYSQDLRDFVFTTYHGNYYSDCSSSICATFRRIGKDIENLNTAGMYYSDLFEDVPVEIAYGHVKNPGILEVGDILLFRGSDPSRPLQIGHVEAVYKVPKTDDSCDYTKVEVDDMTYKFRTIEKGMKGGDVLLVQEILKARGFKGADGKELKLDGECGDNTMFAIAAYIEQRAKDGVDLGGKDGWGKLCWADMAFPVA